MLEVRLNNVETDSESLQAYDAVYGDSDLSQSRSFYLWMYDLLALEPNDRYLDISCGRAELVSLAEQRGVDAHGLDLSHNALKAGEAVHGHLQLATANSQNLPYRADTFDVVSNIGSLEHYVDMRAAVQEMSRVLKPEGQAVILVPNTFSLMNNIWIAFRQGRTSIDPYQPIQRYGARQEWQALLEENGLRVQHTIKYDRVRPRVWADLVTLFRHPKELARLLCSPLVPLNLAFCFVFICTKADVATP